MNKELKHFIQQDLARVYDHPLTIKERFLFPLEMKYLVLWRKASFYRKRYLSKGGVINHVFSFYYGLRLIRLTEKTQINIPAETTIGAGLYIGHLGRIIIHPDAVLGENVNLATGITSASATVVTAKAFLPSATGSGLEPMLSLLEKSPSVTMF